jgi:uncharacterized protein
MHREMSIGTILILVAIGLVAGMLSGFVGVGGGVVIIPALVYFLGLNQLEAQGTSLAIMLPPIGILAVMNYYKTGNINLTYGLIIAATFILGGWAGSKMALKIPVVKVKLFFALFILYVGARMAWSSLKTIIAEHGTAS